MNGEALRRRQGKAGAFSRQGGQIFNSGFWLATSEVDIFPNRDEDAIEMMMMSAGAPAVLAASCWLSLGGLCVLGWV